MLEDALRETFADKSARGPAGVGALDGVADVAIRRARVTRRRHAAVTAGAGIAVVVAAGAVLVRVLSGSDAPGSDPVAEPAPSVVVERSSEASQPPAATVEVIVGADVYAEGKAKLKFQPKAALGPVAKVYRAADGYLVLTRPTPASRRLMLFDLLGNQSDVVVERASYIAVSAKGDRVAWSADDKMTVADRSGAELRAARTVTAPADGGPIGFLGREVILGRSGPAGSPVGFDVWYTDRNYSVTWSTNVVRLFGPLAGGRGLIAQVASGPEDKRACIGLLSPDQPFAVEKRACDLPSPQPDGGAISPDGRWLAYPSAEPDQAGLMLVDLNGVFKESKIAGRWPLPAAPTGMVWLNPSALVIDAGGQVLRADPKKLDRVTTVMASSAGSVLIEPLDW